MSINLDQYRLSDSESVWVPETDGMTTMHHPSSVGNHQCGHSAEWNRRESEVMLAKQLSLPKDEQKPCHIGQNASQ
jgi:hypothetical protein